MLIYCYNVLPIVCGGYVFVFVSILILQSSELVALLLLSCRCLANVNVLWLSLMVPWDGIQCLIVEFPDYILACFLQKNGSRLVFSNRTSNPFVILQGRGKPVLPLVQGLRINISNLSHFQFKNK